MFYNDEIIFMRVELKYCERCGGLHVRRSNSEAKFCVPCMDAERAVMNQVLGGGKKGLRDWLGAMSVLIADSRPPMESAEMGGGRA